MLRPAIVAVPLMLLLSASAHADQRMAPGHGPAAFKSEVQVSISVSFFVPASLDDSEASVKAQERARRMLYESASRECGVLRASIADECRLRRININVRANQGYGQQGPGLNATGSFAYGITLK